jgi:hypothetical protein
VRPTSHVDRCELQFTQSAPPDPHALLTKPASHVPCASQHPAQFVGPQGGGGGAHAPLVHTSLIAAQSVQSWPFTPHVPSFVPALHLPLASQHPAQFCGPHGGVAHAPFEHTSPWLVQLTHASPFAPHAVSCVPTAHTPLMQHPLAHVVGPHVGSQKPFTHCAFAPHDWQISPALPHAAPLVPATHVLPSQHPEQFDGSQVAFCWHAPFVHCVPAVHVLQAAPFAPQSKSSLPGKQSFPTQHPLQLFASHAPIVWHTLPLHCASAPQSMHARPPKPHSAFDPPVRQVLPWQQPVHVDGLHVVDVTHLPATQCSFSPHTWQTLPAAPHALPVLPVSHRPF